MCVHVDCMYMHIHVHCMGVCGLQGCIHSYMEKGKRDVQYWWKLNEVELVVLDGHLWCVLLYVYVLYFVFWCSVRHFMRLGP